MERHGPFGPSAETPGPAFAGKTNSLVSAVNPFLLRRILPMMGMWVLPNHLGRRGDMTVSLEEFVTVQEHVSKDSRGRVSLGPEVMDDHFMVSRNAVGQILLTAVSTVPKHEMWLWRNPAALAAVRLGIQQSAGGKGEKASYSQYANVEIEDRCTSTVALCTH